MQDKANVPLLTVDTVLTPVRPYIADSNLRAVAVFGVVDVLLVLLLYWLLHTDLGLALRATGENEKMVRAQGIDADAMRLIGLALANALVAFSGGLVAQFQGFADVGMGLGMIVAGLAAVIIGETLVRPRGVGTTLIAVAAGSVIYRAVIAAALFIGLGPTDMRLVTSLIVIVALAVPQLRALVMPRPLCHPGGARVIRLEGVTVTFNAGTVNEVRALRGISLTLREGELVTVVGSNGAGKSTLLNALAGVVLPDRGGSSSPTRTSPRWSSTSGRASSGGSSRTRSTARRPA